MQSQSLVLSDLAPDILLRCFQYLSPRHILRIVAPSCSSFASTSRDETLWQHLFFAHKPWITHELAAQWREHTASWIVVFREYSSVQWMHGLWWLEAAETDIDMKQRKLVTSAPRGGFLHVWADSDGLVGDMIVPFLHEDDHEEHMGLGIISDELITVREFRREELMRQRFVRHIPGATGSKIVCSLQETHECTVLRRGTRAADMFDASTADDLSSVLRRDRLPRFLHRCAATTGTTTPATRHDPAAARGPPVPRLFSWVQVQSYAAPSSPSSRAAAADAAAAATTTDDPLGSLARLCGVWIGEYGSHGLQLLLLSGDVGALTAMVPRSVSLRDPAADPPYRDGGAEALETLDLVAIKLTGDPNVPAGQASFCVSAAGADGRRLRCTCRYGCACPADAAEAEAVFAARLQTAQHGYLNPRWNRAEVAALRDGSLLLIWTGMHSRRLRRVAPPRPAALDVAPALPIWGGPASPAAAPAEHDAE